MTLSPARIICLVCDPVRFAAAGTSPFWRALVEAVRECAHDRGDTLCFHFSGDASLPLPLVPTFLEQVTAGSVAGVLAVGVPPRATAWLRERAVPVVAFATLGAITIDVDYPAIIRAGVSELAARGCRRMGLFRPTHGWSDGMFQQRLERDTECFHSALQHAGLEYEASLVEGGKRFLNEGGTPPIPFQEQGYITAHECFSRPPFERPDALVIIDDMLCSGAVMALQVLGIRLERDVSIATHSNRESGVLLGYEHCLTQLLIDPAQIAKQMYAALDLLLEGASPSEQITLVGPVVRRPGD